MRFWTPVEVTSSGHLDARQHKPTDAVVAPEPASANHRASVHLAAQLKAHHSGPPTAIRVPSSRRSATGNPLQRTASTLCSIQVGKVTMVPSGQRLRRLGLPDDTPSSPSTSLAPSVPLHGALGSPHSESRRHSPSDPHRRGHPSRPTTGSVALVTPSQHVTPRPPQSEPGVTQTLLPGAALATAPI